MEEGNERERDREKREEEEDREREDWFSITADLGHVLLTILFPQEEENGAYFCYTRLHHLYSASNPW